MTVDAERAALLDEFRISRLRASERAIWASDDPSRPADTCRYCGRRWQPRAGTQLDGHAACIVTEDFKRRVGAFLQSSPLNTYAGVATVLGVTTGVVSSWAVSAGVAGPLGHALRRRGGE